MKDINGFEIIDVYSRKDAISDGVQIRIPDAIRMEAGIKFPMFVTKKVWEKYLVAPIEMKEQSFDGRVWDLLSIFRHFAPKTSSNKFTMQVIFRMPDKGNWEKHEVIFEGDREMRAVNFECTIEAMDFDDASPVIIINCPGED